MKKKFGDKSVPVHFASGTFLLTIGSLEWLAVDGARPELGLVPLMHISFLLLHAASSIGFAPAARPWTLARSGSQASWPRVSMLLDPAKPGAGRVLEPLPSGEDLHKAVSGTCSGSGLSVVFFSSRQCAACRSFLPRLRRLAATTGDGTTRFFHMEHSARTKEAFQYHEVTEVPTFILFDGDGNLVASKSGLSPSDWGAVRMLIESHADGCATEGAWSM